MTSSPHFDLARISQGLPVGSRRQELSSALRPAGARLVVQAPPGSGKTTVVPAVVANQVEGTVLVTQPRRIAARAAARRLAQLDSSPMGAHVGFTVRGESTVRPGTKVEFVTTGVLVNRLLRTPDLPGVGAVVLDEVHERRLDTDLAFAMLHDIGQLRDELVLVAMSATLDSQHWAGLLGGSAPADVVDIPGELYPLDIVWRPAPGGAPSSRGHLSREFAAHLAHVTVEAFEQDPQGSALVFVPGARDVADLVLATFVPGVEVLGLHGSMDARAQDHVLRGGPKPRIIVSTALAESSLTVPGVRLVVDAGLSREPRMDAGRGVSGLVTVRESRASAEQRAGRAARLGPGRAVRCFSRDSWARMDEHATPEAQVAELSPTVLTLACWGSARGSGMAWPDPLPGDALDRAVATLQGLGALDEDERPTDLGRRLSLVPTEPRLARALLAGGPEIGTRRTAQIVAMLDADERAPGGDLSKLWSLLARGHGPASGRWRHESTRLGRIADTALREEGDEHGAHRRDADGLRAHGTTPDDATALGLVAALARPEWIARRREPGSRSFLTASGTGAELPRESTLGSAQWLAVTELSRVASGPQSSGTLIRAAAVLDEELALQAGEKLLGSTEVFGWDPGSGRVQGRRESRLGAILLTSTPIRPTPTQARPVLLAELAARGLGLDEPGPLRWSPAALALRARLGFLHSQLGPGWPDMRAEALLANAERLLAGRAGTTGSSYHIDLTAALHALLDWHQRAELDRLAPPRLTVASGSAVPVRYPDPDEPHGRPALSVKLQECFGMRESPRIGGVPVVMELLSPARRPLAITDDLSSFWSGAYQQVRAENRARYAKHPWPADPLSAPPRRGTTRSGR